ncbi:asparaginyl-tRNA synthetase [Xylariomycetidae sp. FL2044]|nr:asparaginyl-tRNA synthetase [Xylariomycetidae sp. FL2044]
MSLPRPLLHRASLRSSLKFPSRNSSRAFLSTTPGSVSSLLALKPQDAVSDIEVNGFIRSVRAQKQKHFVTLADGSSIEPIQAVVPSEQADGLTTGAAVRLRGSWVPSPGRGQSHELQVQRATVLGPSDAKNFPLQKKYQTPEYLRSLPHLRPRIPFNAAVLRFRSEIIAALTGFFSSRHFVQTHTPILTSSDCEGAGEVFQISTAQQSGAPPDPPASNLFFRRPVYTTVSAQLHLEALSQALGNVWTLSPTFRAEQSDTPRHLSEFYMLEAELSFVDKLDAVMDLTEDMLRHVGSSLTESGIRRELTMHESRERSPDLAPDHLVQRRWDGLTGARWPRITYTEAIDLLKSADSEFVHEPIWGMDLHTEHEKYIATTVGGGKSPVFVTNYPRNIKAFYMKASSGDADASLPRTTVECFDLLVPDFCEIAGGSMREHRLDMLLDSMRAHGMSPVSSPGSVTDGSQQLENSLDWYIDLRRWGCPPHGGFGLGFDRLICYLSGVQTIRDTAAFPRWYGRCDC